ncbi:MAG: VOC family protein [Saprospiraceae bacterium]
MNYQIQGLTIAITNMEAMLDFYMHVFDMTFIERKMNENRLYSTVWSGLDLLFCPADLARINANQNRHQMDIIVEDLKKVIDVAIEFGGKMMGEIVEDENSKSVGIYDPDGNSILFVEMKS